MRLECTEGLTYIKSSRISFAEVELVTSVFFHTFIRKTSILLEFVFLNLSASMQLFLIALRIHVAERSNNWN